MCVIRAVWVATPEGVHSAWSREDKRCQHVATHFLPSSLLLLGLCCFITTENRPGIKINTEEYIITIIMIIIYSYNILLLVGVLVVLFVVVAVVV